MCWYMSPGPDGESGDITALGHMTSGPDGESGVITVQGPMASGPDSVFAGITPLGLGPAPVSGDIGTLVPDAGSTGGNFRTDIIYHVMPYLVSLPRLIAIHVMTSGCKSRS